MVSFTSSHLPVSERGVAFFWSKLLLVALFAAALFLFIHFRPVRIETLELNSIAPKYMVAQVDFSFLDEEATIILRQEAVRDVSYIFRLSDRYVVEQRKEVERELLNDEEWRERLPDLSFDQLYQALDVAERVLSDLRFTDSRSIKKVEEAGLNVNDYFLFTPSTTEEPIYLPRQIWRSLLRQSAEENQEAREEALGLVLEHFRQKPWKLEEDTNKERMVRQRLQSKVPDKHTQVKAGSRIIDQGEKVQPRHLVMWQAMKRAIGEGRDQWHPRTLVGSALLSLLLTGLAVAYLEVTQPEIANSARLLWLLFTVVLLTLGLAKLVEGLLASATGSWTDAVKYPLFVPFAAILLYSLLNFGIAASTTVFVITILGLAVSIDRQAFMLTNLVASLVAILSSRRLKSRRQIFIVCIKAWVAAVLVIFAIHLHDNTYRHSIMLADILSTGVFMLATAVLVVGILPLLESGFNIMTNVTLMEYMDPNHPLLRRMSMETPGTYQHSMVVGNLAEAAAAAIGANGLLCRVGTLFHDIGKMANPEYFTENQQGGMNIHQLLTPHESAQVIINHIPEGVALAKKARLPQPFIDLIQQHHGTSLVYYFWHQQLEKMGMDESKVNEGDFRYPGPKPQTKEAAVLMIVDAIEAAVRSLDKPDREALEKLAKEVIRHKSEDGQFDECPLTFQDMKRVSEAVVGTLLAVGHTRIKYPKFHK